MSRQPDGRARNGQGDRHGSKRKAEEEAAPARPVTPLEVITSRTLTELLRRLQDTNVLTVYVAARTADPAMRNAWRAALENELRGIRSRLASAPEGELAEFEAAAAILHEQLPEVERSTLHGSWVGFITGGGVELLAEAPLPVSTRAVWRKGPTVAPVMRTLKRLRPIAVAMVDSRSARFYRSTLGELHPLPELSLQVEEPAALASGSGTGSAIHAPRSAVGTEQAQELRRAAFRRMSGTLATRLMEAAGKNGWMMIGGSSEWARLAGEALPSSMSDRMEVVTTLNNESSDSDILTVVERVVTELRARGDMARVRLLVEDAGALGRASAGVPSTQTALHAMAVEQLLISPRFVDAQPALAEDMVRAALLQGADVTVASGQAVDALDRPGTDGVAARLHYPQSTAIGWGEQQSEGADARAGG